MREPVGNARRSAGAARAAGSADPSDSGAGGYQPPSFEVISLDCEISSYAPDGDLPLF